VYCGCGDVNRIRDEPGNKGVIAYWGLEILSEVGLEWDVSGISGSSCLGITVDGNYKLLYQTGMNGQHLTNLCRNRRLIKP
jgi:hypothetical protein